MKMTSLVIKPRNTWEPVSRKNPLCAVVKLDADTSSVEVVLSDESMRKMLDLCAAEIAEQAKARIAEFHAAVTAIDADKAEMLAGPED